MWLIDLPDDVLGLIFRLCDRTDRLAIRQVCSAFCAVVDSGVTDVVLAPHVPVQVAVSRCRRLSWLRKLHVELASYDLLSALFPAVPVESTWGVGHADGTEPASVVHPVGSAVARARSAEAVDHDRVRDSEVEEGADTVRSTEGSSESDPDSDAGLSDLDASAPLTVFAAQQLPPRPTRHRLRRGTSVMAHLEHLVIVSCQDSPSSAAAAAARQPSLALPRLHTCEVHCDAPLWLLQALRQVSVLRRFVQVDRSARQDVAADLESTPAAPHLRELHVHYSFTAESRGGFLVGSGGASHAPPLNLSRAAARLPALRVLALTHDSPLPLVSMFALSEADALALSCVCLKLYALRCALPWALSPGAVLALLRALPRLRVLDLRGWLAPGALPHDPALRAWPRLRGLSGLHADDWLAVAPRLRCLTEAVLPADVAPDVLRRLPPGCALRVLELVAPGPPASAGSTRYTLAALPAECPALAELHSLRATSVAVPVPLLLRVLQVCPLLDSLCCELEWPPAAAAVAATAAASPAGAAPVPLGSALPHAHPLRCLELVLPAGHVARRAATPPAEHELHVHGWLTALLQHCPNLQHWRCYGAIPDPTLRALRTLCPALREVNVRCRLSAAQLHVLSALPLHTLSAGGLLASTRALRRFFAAVPALESLRVAVRAPVRALQAVAQHCPGMRSLRLAPFAPVDGLPDAGGDDESAPSGDDDDRDHIDDGDGGGSGAEYRAEDEDTVAAALMRLPWLGHVRLPVRLSLPAWQRVLQRCRHLRLIEALPSPPADQRLIDRWCARHGIAFRVACMAGEQWRLLEESLLTPLNQVDDYVFVGNYAAAEQAVLLREHGIRHVLCVHLPPHAPEIEDIPRTVIPFGDHPAQDILRTGLLRDCLAHVNRCVEAGQRVLVHCQGGVSRSGSVVVAYLMRKLELSYDHALAYARTKRPCIAPNAGFEQQLRQWEASGFQFT